MQRFETLDAWLAWLETLHPTEIELGLDRVARVARALQLDSLMIARATPDNKKYPKIITVAGTNGKGSFVAATEQLLRSQGARVGAYTSPHLLRYNERIRIAGNNSSDEEIIIAFKKIEAARADISLTYFEFGTLAAFLIFLQSDLDFWLLEVGMGGRLDAVNVLHPDIAVITSIALDHQAWLGNTREEIAIEKAGIVRDGATVIVADKNPPANLRERLPNSTLYLGEAFDAARNKHNLIFRWRGGELTVNRCDLPLASVAAALQVGALLGINCSTANTATQIENLKLCGRLQTIQLPNGNSLLLDVAHNPAATALLAKNISRKKPCPPISAIVAMMADKDIFAALKPLVSPISSWYLLPLKNNPRAAEPIVIADCLERLGVSEKNIKIITDLGEVPEMNAPIVNNSENLLVAFGSFYTIEQVLRYINQG